MVSEILKRKCACLTVGLAALLACAPELHAYFLDLGGGVRPMGLGEAFTAVADDISAMQYNAAGLSRLEQLEITGMYSNLYSNLNLRLYTRAHDYLGYNLLAAGLPVPEIRGGVGLTWKQFNTMFYQENLLALGYGGRVWTWGRTPAEGLTLDAGGNVKWLQWQVDENTYTSDAEFYPYSELQKNRFTADAGVMLRLYSNWSLGISAENLIPADLGLTAAEVVPAVYRLGVAYRLPLESAYADSLMATVEVTNRNHVYVPKAGLESWHFRRSVGLRAGVNTDYVSGGMSCRYNWKSAAVSLQLDYTFTYPWHLADTLGSHWAGLTFGWDVLNPREEEKKQDLARKTQSARRAKAIAEEAARTGAQALADAQAAVQAVDADAVGRFEAAVVKIGDATETATLAAEVVQTAADEARSVTITAMAAEAKQAAAAAAETLRQARARLETVRAQAAETPSLPALPTPATTPEITPLPEKFGDRIVIGIETKAVTDYGSFRELEPLLRNLAAGLQKTVGMKLEWRLLSPAELLLALHQGEVDGVVTYETELDKYEGKGRLEPALTVRKNGRTEQVCCLIGRADSPVKTLAQARGKRLGYSNALIAGRLNALFFGGQAPPSARYFGSLEKQKNARDSLWALQMEAVDVVAEYAYVLDIARTIPDMDVRVIAESAATTHAPLWLRPSRYAVKNAAMQRLTSALQEIHKESAAEPLLKLFCIERLVPVHEKK